MSRLIPFHVVVIGASALAPAVQAADYQDGFYAEEFRPAYGEGWEGEGGFDSLDFEVGTRYWYALGTQDFAVGSRDYTSNDTSHSLEGHLRIEDHGTQTYLKGHAGYSMAVRGSAETPWGSSDILDGRIGYANLDIGYLPLGEGGSGVGFLAGYQYWNDSPNTGRTDFAVITGSGDLTYDPSTGEVTGFPGDSAPNNLDIHALRLGISAKAELGDYLDVTAELAAVPYAYLNGTLGIDSYAPLDVGNTTYVKSSATSVTGWGYGAMGELMLGVHPTENMTVRFGGRAWYLQGTADATYTEAAITDGTDIDGDGVFDPPSVSQQSYISTANPFSLLRYGALVELTYRF